MLRLSAITLATLAALAGCKPPARDAPVRSPSLDYPHPPQQTSDGKVVGADNKPPEQHLGENAGSKGAAPGWMIDKNGIRYDPNKRKGGNLDKDTRDAPAPAEPPSSSRPPPAPAPSASAPPII